MPITPGEREQVVSEVKRSEEHAPDSTELLSGRLTQFICSVTDGAAPSHQLDLPAKGR
jgi:hypothetical protein